MYSKAIAKSIWREKNKIERKQRRQKHDQPERMA